MANLDGAAQPWVSGVMHFNRPARVALERLGSETAKYLPGTFGMFCPYCGLRGPVPRGERVYVCCNPDCRGMVPPLLDAPCKWASRLIVSGGHAYLEPWHSSVMIDTWRLREPRCLVAPYLKARETENACG